VNNVENNMRAGQGRECKGAFSVKDLTLGGKASKKSRRLNEKNDPNTLRKAFADATIPLIDAAREMFEDDWCAKFVLWQKIAKEKLLRFAGERFSV